MKVCGACGGLYATEQHENISGTLCDCKPWTGLSIPPPRVILRSNSPTGEPTIPELIRNEEGKLTPNPEYDTAEYEQVTELH